MDDEREFVIGEEWAAAREAEERRLAERGDTPSPLPPGRYDSWLGQLRLYDIERVPLDDALTSFARSLRELPGERRPALREAVGLDDAYTLLAFARRTAILALRSRDAALVRDGLSALAAIGYERIDPRDGLVALALLHHAALRCDAGPDVLLGEAAAMGEPAFERLVEGFLARSAAERDLREGWGYVEIEGPRGVGLLEWGFAPWMPTHDLAAMSLRIAASLRGDDYAADDPRLAVELPAVWLSAAADPALEPILDAARGAAIINARLRPEATPDHASQQLTAWLVELRDAFAAAHLVSLSLRPHPGHALLGLANGALFVLVVARSVVEGVPSYEDGTRLGRFENGIRQALIG